MLRLLLLAAVSFVGLLLFTSQSSPLSPSATYDYGIFRTIGFGWINGLIPYHDLFDIKGPFFFAIQALGCAAGPGKWIIFIIETLFVTAAAEIIYRIGLNLRAGNLLPLFASVAMIALICLYAEGGNSVEEVSLPFALLPLLGASGLSPGNKTSYIKKWAFISGVCFGCIALIRINNTTIICGIVIGTVISMIKNRQFDNIFKCALIFVTGCSVVLIPFIIYFAIQGALVEMVDACLTTSFIYRISWHENSDTTPVIYIIFAICSAVSASMSWINDRKRGSDFSLYFIPACIISVIILYNGAYYAHYFVMLAPLVACSFIFAGHSLKSYVLPCLITILPATLMIRDNIYTARTNLMVRYAHCSVTNIIPEKERDSIYLYGNINIAGVLCNQDFIPVGKYFSQQPEYCLISEHLKEDIRNNFVSAAPLWIISTREDSLPDYAVGYKLISQNQDFIFWRRVR